MALIKKLSKGFKEKPSLHQGTTGTYFIIELTNGNKILQIDTYGRSTRKIPGKISQSIQFTPEIINELKSIIGELS